MLPFVSKYTVYFVVVDELATVLVFLAPEFPFIVTVLELVDVEDELTLVLVDPQLEAVQVFPLLVLYVFVLVSLLVLVTVDVLLSSPLSLKYVNL